MFKTFLSGIALFTILLNPFFSLSAGVVRAEGGGAHTHLPDDHVTIPAYDEFLDVNDISKVYQTYADTRNSFKINFPSTGNFKIALQQLSTPPSGDFNFTLNQISTGLEVASVTKAFGLTDTAIVFSGVINEPGEYLLWFEAEPNAGYFDYTVVTEFVADSSSAFENRILKTLNNSTREALDINYQTMGDLVIYQLNLEQSGVLSYKGYGACSDIYISTEPDTYIYNDVGAPSFFQSSDIKLAPLALSHPLLATAYGVKRYAGAYSELMGKTTFPYSAYDFTPSYRSENLNAGTYFLVFKKDETRKSYFFNPANGLVNGTNCTADEFRLVLDFIPDSSTLTSGSISLGQEYLMGTVEADFPVREYQVYLPSTSRIRLKSYSSIVTPLEILDSQGQTVASILLGDNNYELNGLSPESKELLSSVTELDTLLDAGQYTIKVDSTHTFYYDFDDGYGFVGELLSGISLLRKGISKGFIGTAIADAIALPMIKAALQTHTKGYGSYLLDVNVESYNGVIDPGIIEPTYLQQMPKDFKNDAFSSNGVWYGEDVARMWAEGMISYESFPNGLFDASAHLTRTESARWIYATFFKDVFPAVVCNEIFQDVASTVTDCVYIEALHTLGVVNGVNGSGSFNPGGEINRAEFAQLVAKSMAIINNANDEYSPFINVPELPACIDFPFDDVAIDAWYCPAVQYLKSENILLGDEGLNTFRPGETINRAETVAVLARVIDDVKAFLVGEYVYSDSQTVCADGTQVASHADCAEAGDSSDTAQDTTNPSSPSTPCTENYASDLGVALSILVEPQSILMAQDETRLFSFNSGQGGLYDIWSDSQQAFTAQLIDAQGNVIDCDMDYSGVSDNFRLNVDLASDTTYYLRVSTPEGGTLHLEWSFPQSTGPIGDGSEAVDHLDDLYVHDVQYPEVSDEGYQFWDAGHLLLNDPKPFAIHENETAVFSFSLPYDATAMTVELPNMEGEHGTFLVRTKSTKEFELSSEFFVEVGQYDPTARFGFNQLNAGIEYEMLITSGSGDIQSTAELSFTYEDAFENPGDDAPNQPLYNSAGRYTYTPARLLSGERFVNSYTFDSASDADMFMFEPERYGFYSLTMQSNVDVQVQVFRNCHADEYDTDRVFTIPANDSSEYPLILTEELGTYFCFKMHGSSGSYSFVLDQHSAVQSGDDYPGAAEFVVTETMQVSGIIDTPQDIDAFTVRTDTTRTFLLDGSLLVNLYNGDELLSSYANGLNGERAYVLKQGVDYTIKAQGAEGETYSFNIQPGLANLPLHSPSAPRGNYSYEIQSYPKQNLLATQNDVNYGYYWYAHSGTLQPFQVAYYNDLTIQYVGGVEDLMLTAVDEQAQLQLDILDGTGAVLQSGVPMFTKNAWQAYPGITGARYYRIQNLGGVAVDYSLNWKNFNNDTIKEYPIALGVRMQDTFDPSISYGNGYQSQPTDLYYFTSDTTGPALFEFSEKQRNATYTIKLKDQYGQLMQIYDQTIDAFTFLAEQGEQYSIEISPEYANTYSNNTYLFALHALNSSEFTSQELAAMPVSPNFFPEVILNDLSDIRATNAFTFDASESIDVDGEIISYDWVIGGVTYQGAQVVHTFASQGEYLVELVVTDNDGGLTTLTQSITVLPGVLPPVADFSPHIQPPYQGSTLLYLNASASYSPEGHQIVWWEWDINADGVRDDTGIQLGRYFPEGAHEITLTVRDDQGDEGSVTKTITIDPLPRDNFAETYDTAQEIYLYQYRNAELVSDMDKDYYEYIHQGGPGYVTFYTSGNTDTTCQQVNRYWHYYGYWAEQYYQYNDNGAGGVNCKVTMYAQYAGQRIHFVITKKPGTPAGGYTLRSYPGW